MASTLLSGKDLILFFRKYADKATTDGSKLKFQTEHSISKEKENEAVNTKDGIIQTITDGENTADITSLAYVDDNGTQEVWRVLEEWFDDGELVEVWEVDITTATETGEYKATYYQGYFTSFEKSAPSDGQVELSINYAINGKGARGTDQLTPEQVGEINNTLYEYETIKAIEGQE